MIRRDFIRNLSYGATGAFFSSHSLFKEFPLNRKTNFVFFLIDDLGWNDLSCYGSTFYETPHTDRLAVEGIRFSDAYAASPVCSPTRASIMTGKYPARLHITDWIPGDDPGDRKLLGPPDLHFLPLREETIAETFKSYGYATGYFGKWHLGGDGFLPEDQGFDLNVGGSHAGQPASYFYPYKSRLKQWDVPGLEGGEPGEYLTDRLSEEAVRFIEKNREKPFFLYLAHYAVHTPIQAKEEQTGKYKAKLALAPADHSPDERPEHDVYSKLKQDHPEYAAMIQSVDDSVGAVMDKLSETGLSENTFIIFMSDNGGLSTLSDSKRAPTSIVPLRAGKGWLYEGGIRVPMIIKGPGLKNTGSVCNQPVISTDFYPTLLELAGLNLRPSQHLDGISLGSLLKHGLPLDRKTLFWHYPHYHGSGHKPAGAVRSGNWKLIEWFEDGSLELYHLREDIEESDNLAEKEPEIRNRLYQMLRKWRRVVGAQMPKRITR